jgi:hypothetical protein
MFRDCCRSGDKGKGFGRNGTTISKIYERNCCESMRYGDTCRIFSIVFSEIKTFYQSFVEIFILILMMMREDVQSKA